VQAEAALHQAEEAVQLAQAAAETARESEGTGSQIAEQQVVQAQAAVDKLQLPAEQDKLAAAQAALAQAQAAQARLTAAPRDSQKALAEAGVAQAQAALEQAQISRERSELRAPFDGVVAQVNVDSGDPSAPGAKPAISMVDVSALHVDVQISDADITRVGVGQEAEVRADALEPGVFAGMVSYIAPTATVQGAVRTYLVRLTLDNQNGLRPGMSVRVELKTK
jgi:HlyD family secretion protein